MKRKIQILIKLPNFEEISSELLKRFSMSNYQKLGSTSQLAHQFQIPEFNLDIKYGREICCDNACYGKYIMITAQGSKFMSSDVV
jgi:hypothetical protein